MTKQNNVLKGYIYVILSALIFGCMPLMAKYIYLDGVNSLTLVFLRNFISVPFLAFFALVEYHSLKINPKSLVSVSFIAFMGGCLTPLLLFASYNYIASGTATVFHSVYPAVVVLVGFIASGFKDGKMNFISVIVCLFGICLFYNPAEPINLTGSAVALLSGVTYAIYILMLSSFRYKEISGFLFTFYIALISSLIMFAICFLGSKLSFPTTVKGWILTVFFAFAINVGAVVLFQMGTFYIGGQRAAILSTVEPITSIFVGALVFNEVIGVRTGVGSVLVICASIMVALFDIKKSKM